MKTLAQMRCMIYTGKGALAYRVLELAKQAGFSTHGVRNLYNQYVFGKWNEGNLDSNIYDAHGWDNSLFKQHPDWPRFDARTEMDKIIAHFRVEEYDETPLPHDMDKELVEQTKKKFNLSPEQWDAIPPLAREALAQTEVKVISVKKDASAYEWISVRDRVPPDSDTVIVTKDPTDSRNNVYNVGAAYYSSGGWLAGNGRIEHGVTHWAELPQELGEDQVERTPDEDTQF